MSQMKAVIFDLDGVLVFTDEFHYLAWRRMADREGIPFDRTINNDLRGVSRMASLEIILRKASRTYSEAEKLELADYKNNYYKTLLAGMSPSDVEPRVLSSLAYLRSKGVKLAIGSSSKNTGFILDKTGIRHFFDAVSDGNSITRSKPDPEVFLNTAKMLGLDPSECYVVEDARSGIDAAKAGGFTSIGIGEAKLYGKTDIPINSLEDLKTLF